MYVDFNIKNMAFKEGGSHLLIDKTYIVFKGMILIKIV